MRHFKHLTATKPLKATTDPLMEKLDMLAPLFEQDPALAMDLLNSVLNKEEPAAS